MEKNYYEILEVDVKASKEMIDRAFKLLAKRYHPDTKPQDKKEWAEANFKKINEAYEVLSNEESRKEYDTELEYEKNSAVEALCAKNEHLQNLVDTLQNELSELKEYYNKHNQHSNVNSFSVRANVNNTGASYSSNMHNPSYSPNNSYVYYNNPINQDTTYYYKPTTNRLKDLIAFIITALIIIGIGTLLWKIPFAHNFLLDLYNENAPIKSIVDFIVNIF